MSILHILNIADWFIMGAGVAATGLMMLVGEPGDHAPRDKKVSRKGRRSPNSVH